MSSIVRVASSDMLPPNGRCEWPRAVVQRALALAALAALLMAIIGLPTACAADAAVGQLRLVPFPKEVRMEAGAFDFQRGAIEFDAPAAQRPVLERLLSEEIRLAQLPALGRGTATADGARRFRIARHAAAADGVASRAEAGLRFRPGAGAEDYRLLVRPDEILCVANGDAGLVHGMQTLRQLIRANRRGGAIPCVS